MSILIHDHIEFHNAAALEERAGLPGLRPVRLPREVREPLNHGARFMGGDGTGIELRFVTETRAFRLALAAHEGDVGLTVYRGGFEHSSHSIPAGATRVIHLAAPDHFDPVVMTSAPAGPFSPDIWRIQISSGSFSYLGMDTGGVSVRPPRSEEKPGYRWLAHGSSITHAWGKGYPHLAARRLGVDVLNKGLAGSCQCELELAEHFATAETWDLATLELGVNMRGIFSVEEFSERADGFVRCLRRERPAAPIVLITHFTNRDHQRVFPRRDGRETDAGKRQRGYNEVLRGLAEDSELNLQLIEGPELLPDAEGLTCDLLHPSSHGHIQMGERLAERLRPLVVPLSG